MTRRERIAEHLWNAIGALGAAALIVMALQAARCSTPGGLAVADLPINQPPRQGATLAVQEQVAAIYDGAARDINTLMARALERLAKDPNSAAGRFERARAAQLLAQLEARVRRADIEGVRVIDAALRDSVQLGLAQAQSQMRGIGFTTRTPDDALAASFANIDASVSTTIARDTAARLSGAANSYAVDAQRLFRTLALDTPLGGAGERETNLAIARGLLTGDPRVAERALRQRFASRAPGVVESYRQIGARRITVGGWTGPVRTYTQTVMRTRTREATVASRHEGLAAAGIDLVQIVGRRSVNFCTDFLGLVCVINGPARDGYPAISSLPNGGPPFHPNCSKGTIAFVADLASPERLAIARSAAAAFRTRAA